MSIYGCILTVMATHLSEAVEKDEANGVEGLSGAAVGAFVKEVGDRLFEEGRSPSQEDASSLFGRQLQEAQDKDMSTDGADLSAGLYGFNVSELLRLTAERISGETRPPPKAGLVQGDGAVNESKFSGAKASGPKF